LIHFLIIQLLTIALLSTGLEAQTLDILIRNGSVIDGSGSPAETMDVGIQADRIVLLEANSHARATRVIDASGLIVAPGFIDPHTHTLGDLNSRERRGNEPYLMQGVTTVITGNDGSSPVDIARALAHWNEAGIGTNAALFIGEGSVRAEVMGMSAAPASPEQLERMKALVARGLKAGAAGMSTGLFYAPGSFASTDEIIALAKNAAAGGGIYDTHMRDESSYSIGLLAAVNETIRVGREAGLPVHISHIKALGKDTWGMSPQVIALIRQARQDGVRITASQYPYEASGTSVGASLLPRWAEAGGKPALLSRFADPSVGPGLLAEMEKNLERRGGPESILITKARNTALNGHTLGAIAKEQHKSPVEAAVAIIKDGDAGVASFNMRDDDIKNFMREDWVMTCSDGSDGHPRKYGTYPRKLRKYVLDEHVISMPFAIRSSTSLPAETFGFKNRGLLKIGFFADITLFDPNTIRDNATYEHPQILAAGIRYLFVNGKLAVDNGRRTDALAGRVLPHPDKR
jgi:N-acyl-D-aspartate/D-glutamate deacylase